MGLASSIKPLQRPRFQVWLGQILHGVRTDPLSLRRLWLSQSDAYTN